MKKLFVIFCLFFASFGNNFSSVHAETVDFVHDIKATYEVRKDAPSLVEYEFKTTNKIDNDYLQTFSFKLPFEPKNIHTDGSSTPVKATDVKKLPLKNMHQLSVDMLEPVHGINKSFTWKIKFEIENLVLKYGLMDAVILPSFSNESAIENFTVEAFFPSQLGKLSTYYGDPVVNKTEKGTSVLYESKKNRSSNYIFLLGDNQEFSLKTSKIGRDTEIFLPQITSGQKVFYSTFPSKSMVLSDNAESLSRINLQKDEEITGTIKVTDIHDAAYVQEFNPIRSEEIAKVIAGTLQVDGLNNDQKVKNLAWYLYENYDVIDFITDANSTVSLNPDKKTLNAAELSEIFSDVLSVLQIENRSVFGFVFPIQQEYDVETTAQVHIWNEYWNGTYWVSADPAWMVSSKGTEYFERNWFHHISFGSYKKIEELKTFFQNSELITIKPLTVPSDILTDYNIQLSTFNETSATKELRLGVTNKSQMPIYVKSVQGKNGGNSFYFNPDTVEINRVLYPNSRIDITFPVSYTFLIKSRDEIIKTEILYSDLSVNASVQKSEFANKIVLKSNVSRYLIIFAFIVISIFAAGCVSAVIYWKKKIIQN